MEKNHKKYEIKTLEFIKFAFIQHVLAEVFVMKASEIGVVDKQYSTISHLGHLLHPGDTVMGQGEKFFQ